MAYLTQGELETALRNAIQLATGTDLSENWSEIVASSLTAGKGEILSRLGNRGFSPTQIAGWYRLAEYHRDLSLYWILSKGGIRHTYDDTQLNKLNRAMELDTIAITDADGNLILPDVVSYDPDGIGSSYGGLLDDATDRIRRDEVF